MTRGEIYRLLLSFRRVDLFPAELCTWEAMAETDLVCWLCHPNELGCLPGEIDLVKQVPVHFSELLTDLHYFVFRFRKQRPHWAAKRGWLAGVAGPYNVKSSPMPGGRHTFSRFEPFDSRSAEAHVEAVRQLFARTMT
jgi:hypothetical protein